MFERGIDEARKVFDIMIVKDCEPNFYSYNILINGYFKSEMIVDALYFLKRCHLGD